MDDLVPKGGHSFVSRRVEAQIDLPVGADGADEAFQRLAGLERGGKVVVVKQAPVRVFDDGVVAQGRPANDEEADLLPVVIRRRLPAEVTVQARGGHDSVCLLVQKDMDNHAMSNTGGRFLFAEGQQQILGQPPVQESANVRIDADDLQTGELADGRQRLLRGGHEAVLGIAIDKDIHFVLGPQVRRNIAARQKYFAQFPAVQVEARRRGSDDSEEVAFADDGHAPYFAGERRQRQGERNWGAQIIFCRGL